MIGIDNDILDKIIKINNINLEDLNSKRNELLKNINNLKDSYSGVDLDFAFNEAFSQKSNINKILDVINNYSEVLSSVKFAYNRQDANIANTMNHINSKF